MGSTAITQRAHFTYNNKDNDIKNVMTAAVAAMTLTATSAFAGDLAFVGETEYVFEAETFSLEGGAEYAINDFTFEGLVKFDDANDDVDFTGAEVTVSYALTNSVDAYVRVEGDCDWDHDETVVGAAFKF